MTPLELEILLHYYRTPGYPPGRSESEVSATKMWVKQGMLKELTAWDPYNELRITPRGKCLIEEILATPFPIQTWKVER